MLTKAAPNRAVIAKMLLNPGNNPSSTGSVSGSLSELESSITSALIIITSRYGLWTPVSTWLIASTTSTPETTWPSIVPDIA